MPNSPWTPFKATAGPDKLLRKSSFLPTRKPPQFIECICCQIERNLLPPSALCCVLGTYGKHLPPRLQYERQQPTSFRVLLNPKLVTSIFSLWQHKMGDVLRTLECPRAQQSQVGSVWSDSILGLHSPHCFCGLQLRAGSAFTFRASSDLSPSINKTTQNQNKPTCFTSELFC